MKKNSNEITSVDCIKYVPNVTVHKEPKLLKIGNSKCLLMPWRKDSDHEKETLLEFKKQKPDYLFCHTETQGVQTSPNTKHLHEGGNDLNVFKDFKKVYSGHIHYRQEKGNFVLVGNPYQMTRSDRGNTKGIYILDLDTNTHRFIPNDRSPMFIRYYINDLLDRRIGELESEIEGNFVDIQIPSNVLGKYNINRFLDILDGKAKSLEPKIYDEDNPIDYGEVDESDLKGEVNLLKIADDFIANLNYDESLKDRLKHSILELYKQALTYET
jgi:hypothetical protein